MQKAGKIAWGTVATIAFTAAGAAVSFVLTDHDRLGRAEASIVAGGQREVEFRREVLQSLSDIKQDIREMREAGEHIRWRELPPSPYRRPAR